MAEKSSSLDQIKELLSDPKQLERLAPLIDMLAGGKAGAALREEPEKVQEEPAAQPEPMQAPSYEESGQSLQRASGPPRQGRQDGLSMDTILRVKGLYDSLEGQNDRRLNLLSAIRPYMRESRAAKLDTAMKILKVTKIGEAMKDMDKF